MNAVEPVTDNRPEIQEGTYKKIDRWADLLDKTAVIDKRSTFEAAAADLFIDAQYETDLAAYQSIKDDIATLGLAYAGLDQGDIDFVMVGAEHSAKINTRGNQANGHAAVDEPPFALNPEEFCSPGTTMPATIDDTSLIAPAKFITPAAWPNEAPPPVDWLVPGFIQRGDVTTLHGDGGAGKTDIALRLAANVARGATEWLGLELSPTANGPVVFISAEDPERKVRRRLWHHAKHDGYDLNAVTNLNLWFPAKMSGTVLAVPDRYTGTMKPTRTMHEIAAAVAGLAPALVIADNVAATYGGNQNDRAQVRSFVNLWADIAETPSTPAVLLLDHPSLSGLTNNTGRGGNMDWRNAVRSALHLYAPADKAEADRGIRILETTKINEGKPGNPVRLVWAEGGLQREAELSSPNRAAKEQQCDEIFLRLLDERNAQGGHVGRKTSAMYAPKVFAETPDNGGFAKSAFAKSMERPFAAGILREVWDPKRRHDYIDRAASA
jgi:RecA-family ATPase